MFMKIASAVILCVVSAGAFANGYAKPVVMTNVTQLGDNAQLRFDAAPARSGELVVVDKTANAMSLKRPFSYEVEGGKKTGPRGSTVDLKFNDGQRLTISCDPLSDNCHSTDFLTEGPDSFSISWVITRK